MKRLVLLSFAFALAVGAQAQILWTGAEDIDFPNGPNPACTSTNSTYSADRPGFGRGIVNSCGAGLTARSLAFPGGAVTSAWVHAQSTGDNDFLLGLVKSGTLNSVLFQVQENGAVSLSKWDGTTLTVLGTSATGIIPTAPTTQLDFQIQNYGASCVLKIYVNASSSALLSYSGNCAVGSNTNLDAAIISQYGDVYNNEGYSEIIVSSADTRALGGTSGLVTLAPNANGALQQWIMPGYQNINPISINDSNFTNDNTAGDMTRYKMTCLPSGTFSILDVRVIARGAKQTSGITSVALGFYNGTSDQLGASQGLAASFGSVESDFAENPFTSAPWQASDIGCSSSSTTLNLELKSGS